MTQKQFNVVSLFSGAMGLDVGLEQSGRFAVRVCVEVEHAFCETIRANIRGGRLRSDLKVFEADIRNVDPHEVLASIGLQPGELDLLVGGPPCQSFSTAGRRASVQDPRGTLLWQYLRFVQAMKPRFFLMENVRGLLSAALRHRPIAERPENGGAQLSADEEPGSVVRAFAEDLSSTPGAAYHMDGFEVNAVNYGAPQLRERVLFIGNRFGAQVDFPNPTHGPPLSQEREQGSLFQSREQVLLPWATLGNALGGLAESCPTIMDFSPRKKAYLAMVPPGSNWRSLPIETQRESMGSAWYAKGGRSGWWRRLTFDLPSPTLMTMPNHASTSLCHPTETRALTVREYARVQEFPDDWEVCGKLGQQYAQIGNAVPVRLGRVAGDVIAASLDRIELSDEAPVAPLSAYRVIYVQSHVRTRQWFKAGETFVWRDGDATAQPAYAGPKTRRKSRVL